MKNNEHEQNIKFTFIPKHDDQNLVLNKNMKGNCVELNSNVDASLESPSMLIEEKICNDTKETAEEENTAGNYYESALYNSKNCKEDKRKSNHINMPCALIDRTNQQQLLHFQQNVSDSEFHIDSETVSDTQLGGKPLIENLESNQPNKFDYQHNSKKEAGSKRKLTTKKLCDSNVKCKKNMSLPNKKQHTIPSMFSKIQMKLSSADESLDNGNPCKRKIIIQKNGKKKTKFIAPLKDLPIQVNIIFFKAILVYINSE